MQYALELKKRSLCHHTLEGETYALKDITFSVREGNLLLWSVPPGVENPHCST